MPQYDLTDWQKEILLSIVPGLKDGTVSTTWIILTGDNRVRMIHGLDRDGKIWRGVMEGKVERADFATFVDYGFFRPISGKRDSYTLNKQLIINVVESGFEIPQKQAPIQTMNQFNIGHSEKQALHPRVLEFLRRVVAGLEKGTVDHTWIIDGRGEEISIFGLPDDLTVEVLNGMIKSADIKVLIRYGYLIHDEQDAYSVNEQKMIDALKESIPSAGATQIMNQSNDLRGISQSNININSSLTNSQQIINAIPNMDNESKQQLTQLMAQLAEALQAVPEEHSESKEAVEIEAESLLEACNKEKPNSTVLKNRIEGLRKAAENIASIAKPVADIVMKILPIISALHR